MKVGCIGTGMMGGALIRGISKSISPENILVYDTDLEKAKAFAVETGCKSAKDISEIASNCSHIILAVKPNVIKIVIESLKDSLENNKNHIIISIAAGVKISAINEALSFGTTFNKAKIVRLMPNLPATVGEGMIALSANDNLSVEEITQIKEMLSKAGKVEQVPETLMDCVTGVSGSGPAYGFLFIEAMADAAVLCGMPRNQAYTYAAQTLKGAAQMVLETGKHPAELKDAVCSPGGTTIEGVKALEDNGFRSSIIAAVKNATDKSKALAK